MTTVTRLGLYGGPGLPYGSFAGKTEQEPAVAFNFSGGISEAISRQRLRRLAIQQGLRKDDDEILALILAAVNFTRGR